MSTPDVGFLSHFSSNATSCILINSGSQVHKLSVCSHLVGAELYLLRCGNRELFLFERVRHHFIITPRKTDSQEITLAKAVFTINLESMMRYKEALFSFSHVSCLSALISQHPAINHTGLFACHCILAALLSRTQRMGNFLFVWFFFVCFF